MPTFNLTEDIRALLKSCPTTGAPGGGVHNWLFVTALKLQSQFPDKTELVGLLIDATANCGREVPSREVEQAVWGSLRVAAAPNQGLPVGPRWPGYDIERVRAILRDGPGLEHLQSASPLQWKDNKPHSEEIVDTLFPGNPLLCAAREKERAMTAPRSLWRRRLSHQQFIVPSPMRSVFGETQDGHMSHRCAANVGPRRFLVVEFDQGSFNEHAALLSHLGESAPLTMVVLSGNKSVHGWFYCQGEAGEKVEKFFKYAVSLGADRATWTRCQFVRMPDGLRDNGKRQRVVFFNPQTLQAR